MTLSDEQIAEWREDAVTYIREQWGLRPEDVGDIADTRIIALADALTKARRGRDNAHDRWADELDARYAAEGKLARIRELADEMTEFEVPGRLVHEDGVHQFGERIHALLDGEGGRDE